MSYSKHAKKIEQFPPKKTTRLAKAEPSFGHVQLPTSRPCLDANSLQFRIHFDHDSGGFSEWYQLLLLDQKKIKKTSYVNV